MVEAKRLTGAPGKVVALVGDGALTGGMAFEGLNQAGYLGRDLLVVLNDNEMSISPNVGACLGVALEEVRLAHVRPVAPSDVKTSSRTCRTGPMAIEMMRRGLEATKALITPGMLFEALGFQYVGPVDGHDVAGLVETFAKLALFDGPVLLHALTTKGKGYPPAEADAATRGHALSFFDARPGSR